MKTIMTLCLALFSVISAHAQTMTASITTQPCNNNGVCSVTVTGLSLPVNYTYYNSGIVTVHNAVNSLTDQLINFPAKGYGSMYVVATDGTNTATGQVYYTLPFFVQTSYTAAVCPSTVGIVSAMTFSGSPGPFTYNWTNINTATSYTGSTFSAPVGNYSLMVTDQVTGCVMQIDSASTVNSVSNINLTFNTTPANCTNGTASVTASGGVMPYNYLWSNGATTPSITGLIKGIYTATVTDSQGCINNYSNGANVTQNPNINVNTTITNATCVQTNGGAMAFGTGGTGPYTYLWGNGQTTQALSGVQGGQYYPVVVTDANGCIGTGGANVGVSTPINVTYTTSPSSCTLSTGSAGVAISGGTAPYTTIWYTYPSTTSGTTVTGLPPGTYGFKITDAVGCIRTGSAYIPPVSTINAGLSTSPVICPATTGSITATVSGTNGPFTYTWSNTATTSQINNVPLGTYSCKIKDAVGCSVTKSIALSAISPVSIGLSSTPATCIYNADGSILANATGGTAPYTYHWSNGQTTATATGLLTGNLYVTSTDANGCSQTKSAFVGYNAANSSCYCTISGKVYRDANSNCTIDGGETGISNIMIHCANFGYAFTDANGNYSFRVPTGTYTLSESVNATYPLAPCQSNAVVQSVTAASGCTTTVNFANNVVTLHDLHIITTSYPYNAPIPGNPYFQKVIIENNGTVSEPTVQIGYTTDGQLGGFIASPALFTQQNATTYPNWYSVQTGFPTLAPGTSSQINLTYNTPTNIPIGTTVNFYDTTAYAAPLGTVWLLDQTPWDNVQNYQQTVIGSYDPNFKEVSPKGTGPQGYIASKDSILSYVIHFQNEGTYFAQNVSVKDSLDANLDWTTLRPGYSDHSYTTTVSEGGVVTFKFANINLPWKSQYGDVMSSGMVSYTIKRKRQLAQGSQIKNKAAIYFDYNAPVITNTTLNTLKDLNVSIDEKTRQEDNSMILYPNPATNLLNVFIQTDGAEKIQVNVIDLAGKLLQSREFDAQAGDNVFRTNIAELASGIYFIQVKQQDVFTTKKLVVIK